MTVFKLVFFCLLLLVLVEMVYGSFRDICVAAFHLSMYTTTGVADLSVCIILSGMLHIHVYKNILLHKLLFF